MLVNAATATPVTLPLPVNITALLYPHPTHDTTRLQLVPFVYDRVAVGCEQS